MHDRTALGSADVDDDRLAAIVAALWQVPSVELLASVAEPVAYDLPAITTASRTWVSGSADDGSGPRDFRVFVKVVQNWRHSPFFAFVPPEVQEWAAQSVPWRAEPLVCGSDLARALPEGLRMPRALAVIEIHEEASAIWLEAIEATSTAWTRATYIEAAFLLGRLAGSASVRPFAAIDPLPWAIDHYIQGRLVHDVLPTLASDEPWQHPLVASAFHDVRERLQASAARVHDLAAEFRSLPFATAHGDATPGNLLRVANEPGFVLIDYGFWRPQPVGHDLGQLLVGELQLGRRGAEDLADLDRAITESYVEGLRAEGDDTPLEVVRRGHAVSMFIFSGVSTLPTEMFQAPDTPELRAVFAARAALASYSLDLLDATNA